MGNLKLNREKLAALPTILEVVEKISALENKLMLPKIAQVPSPDFYDEGRYNFVADERNRNIVHLMPTSQSPFTLYRGQSRYYDPCLPSLYRGDPSEEDVAGNRLKICEFALLLDTHPVFQEIGRNLMVEPIALAQHYGLTTECLDITNSKWVAAFFACTDYDYDTDTYTPVGSDFKEGYGVMYITKEWVLKEKPMENYEKYGVIGFQYFDRPTKQSSFGVKLSRDEDFNKSPYFDKIFFRHDLAASTMVYNMSYQQNRFIPRDPLSKLARTISESKEITRRAHYLCWNRFYADKSPGFLDKVCEAKGWKIRENNKPIAEFEPETLATDWKKWNEYGRADLESRILPTRVLATLDNEQISNNL